MRVFATFTEDLTEMARWLTHCGITTVAMESTEVYWIPLYDVLEQHGVNTAPRASLPECAFRRPYPREEPYAVCGLQSYVAPSG